MRIIAHLDMDAFFASVEERDHPSLHGLPIVIGADPLGGRGRGVVATANYKARAYGIHSALPISRAWRLSEQARQTGKPAAVFLAGNHKKYQIVSDRIMSIIRKHAAVVEQASIDEAYFEISGDPKNVAQRIKRAIKNQERLTCSIGIGPNKLIAKIAAGFQKPDGLTVVTSEAVEQFLNHLSIREIPGIGPKTATQFNQRGIFKIHELKKLSRAQLRELLGKWGDDLYDKARGIDNSPVSEEYEIKSIGEQETFRQDTVDINEISDRLFTIADNVFKRFTSSDFAAFRAVVITVRFFDFETKLRSHTLPKPSRSRMILRNEALKLFLPFLDKRENPQRKPIRLIGVRIEKLT